VTQYRTCVRAGACTPPGTGVGCNWGRADREDHPVNCLRRSQAEAFCEWLGARLPSEAEFEYAARSRGQNFDYPWGNEQATCAYAILDSGVPGCGTEHTWPVCSRDRGRTVQGLCDLSGNVWEMVADCYQDSYRDAPTDSSPRTECTGPASTNFGVRGGGYYNYALVCRAAYRDRRGVSYSNRGLGFRPAR